MAKITQESLAFFLTSDFPSLISLTSCPQTTVIPRVKKPSPHDQSQSRADLFFQVPPQKNLCEAINGPSQSQSYK